MGTEEKKKKRSKSAGNKKLCGRVCLYICFRANEVDLCWDRKGMRYKVGMPHFVTGQRAFNWCCPQGEQGLQGPPGPFEYVDPPEELYIKGEQVTAPRPIMQEQSSFRPRHLTLCLLFVLSGSGGAQRGLWSARPASKSTPGFYCVLRLSFIRSNSARLDFQGLDVFPGVKGEKGIVGLPGPRVRHPSLVVLPAVWRMWKGK